MTDGQYPANGTVMTAFGFAVVLTVSALFIWSGVAKLRTGTFPRQLAEYDVLPPVVVAPVARTLPFLEVALGVAILVGVGVATSLVVAASLLVVFTVGMTVNLLRGHRVDCGCHGSSKPISWALVARNLALVGAVTAAAVTGAPPGVRALAGAGSLPSASASAVMLMLVILAVATRLAAVTWALTSRLGRVRIPATLDLAR